MKKWMKYGIVGLACFLGGAVAALVFSMMVYFVFAPLRETGHQHGPHHGPHQYFQYSEINHNTKEMSLGYVEANDYFSNQLDEKEYFSYRNEETGNFIMITKFGQENYRCSGACYCSDSRRSILSRGMFIVLSAFTTGVATNMAKEVFADECEQKFAEGTLDSSPMEETPKVEERAPICAPKNIEVKVEKCKPIKDEEIYEDEERLQTRTQPLTPPIPPETEMVEDKELKPYRYNCKGWCVDNLEVERLIGKEFLEQQKAEGSGSFALLDSSLGRQKSYLKECYHLEMTAHDIVVECTGYNKECKRKAQEKFSGESLVSFCKEESMFPYLRETVESKAKGLPINMCTSQCQDGGESFCGNCMCIERPPSKVIKRWLPL